MDIGRKRARTGDQKEARRASILNAARVLIDEAGFEGVTMNAVATRAGVSKGTLYLYVQTKEELFLELFVEAMQALTIRLESEATEATLIEVMGRAPQEVPLFLPLLARLLTVIEPNVADAPLFEAKRRMRALGRRAAAVISRLTGAPADRAREAAIILMMTMQGAAQFDLAARRPPQTVPEDLRADYAAQSFAVRFPAAARMILSGLR